MSSDMKEYAYQELLKITERDNLEIYLVKKIRPDSVFMMFEHEKDDKPFFFFFIRDYSNFGWIYRGGFIHFEESSNKMENIVRTLFKMDLEKAWNY